jgi:NADH dehydrogenase
VGDCALPLDPRTDQPVPATAQLALQEGGHAADNVLRALAGQEPTPFNPHSRGEVVSIGHDRAVGWTKVLGDKQIKLRGLIGGVAKRAAEAEWELHLWRETFHLDGVFH